MTDLTELTHSRRVDIDYNEVFNIDEVKRLDFVKYKAEFYSSRKGGEALNLQIEKIFITIDEQVL